MDARNAAAMAAGKAVGGGLMLKFGAGAAALMLIGIILAGAISGGGGSESSGINPCNPPPIGQAPPPATGPTRTQQVANAATIDSVAVDLGMPGLATLVALMTALQESSLLNIDHGDRDSVGLFQQRPSQGWGTVEQIMDPIYSSTKFLTRLATVEGWPAMRYTDAAQAVQISAFPEAYAKHEATARDIAAEAGIDLTRAGDPYLTGIITISGGDNGVADPATGGVGQNILCPDPIANPPGDGGPPPGGWPPEDCTVDDPTSTGCLTPRTMTMYTATRAHGYGTGWACYAPRPGMVTDHNKGRACDVTFGNAIGQRPTPDQEAAGWAMTTYLQANAGPLAIHYLIWQGQIWNVERAAAGWQPYNGGRYYDPGSITGGHYDHVHISVY